MSILIKKRIVLTLFCILTLVIGGCARVAIYSDDALETETGIKFYIPKPYLFVANTGAKDKPVDISVIYLPDLMNPFYAKAKTGLGASDLSMSFSNGMLTSYGVKNDSKIPELINALGSFASSASTAAKTFMAQAGADYTEKGTRLSIIAKDLDNQLKIARTKNILTKLELQIGESISKTISESGKLLQGPEGSANVIAVIANLTQALKAWDNIRGPNQPTASEVSILANISIDKSQVSNILDELKKATGSTPEQNGPAFFLFEIDNSSGTTKLNKIN